MSDNVELIHEFALLAERLAELQNNLYNGGVSFTKSDKNDVINSLYPVEMFIRTVLHEGHKFSHLSDEELVRLLTS